MRGTERLFPAMGAVACLARSWRQDKSKTGSIPRKGKKWKNLSNQTWAVIKIIHFQTTPTKYPLHLRLWRLRLFSWWLWSNSERNHGGTWVSYLIIWERRRSISLRIESNCTTFYICFRFCFVLVQGYFGRCSSFFPCSEFLIDAVSMHRRMNRSKNSSGDLVKVFKWLIKKIETNSRIVTME